jgi:hypothetical protein
MSKLLQRGPGGIDPITGLSKNRIHERTQGCWNCKHGSSEVARKWWLDKREKDLEIAVNIAIGSPDGEKDHKVVNIRRTTALIDEAVGNSSLIKCTGNGVDRHGNSVGDLVRSVYLCHKWSGAQGASIARAGEAPDLLPQELEEKANETK